MICSPWRNTPAVARNSSTPSRRYVDRYRRIRIGPKLTLIFENRQTLWFRVQEVIRIARLAEPGEVQRELNLYNRLLPCAGLLQAALLIEIADSAQLLKELAPWRRSGRRATAASRRQPLRRVPPDHLPTRGSRHRHRPLDHLPASRRPPHAAGEFLAAHFFRFESPLYQHQSEPLSDEFRQSLLDDLALSDRDAA